MIKITTEDYNELNKYLNDIFMLLEEKDFFLLSNIYYIARINAKYLDGTTDYEIKLNEAENNLSFEDVYLLAREIIESINKEYLKDYDNLIQTGELDFDYENKIDDSMCLYINDARSKPLQKLIEIKRVFSYVDVAVLIHEFIHYTNSESVMSINRYLLTEFLSIYFEMYAINYLIDKGINKEELDFNDRIDILNYHSKSFDSYAVVLLSYEKFGSVDIKHLPLINQYYCGISEDEFENDCSNVLKHLKNIEKKYKSEIIGDNEFDQKELVRRLSDSFTSNYRYILGTLLSIYALKYADIKDIVYLNDHINDDDFAYQKISMLLKQVGLDITEPDFENKLIESVIEYVDKYNNKKSR